MEQITKICKFCEELRTVFVVKRGKVTDKCRECKNKECREVWRANSETLKSRRRERWEKDSSGIRTRQKEKYHKNKDLERQKARDRYAAKIEVMRQRSRDKHKKFKEKRNAYIAEFFRNHPEITTAKRARRRTRQTEAGGSFSGEEWLNILNKYGNKCLCCGSSDLPLTADHIVPVALGGSSSICNIQPLCQPCNSSKRISIIDYRPDCQYHSITTIRLHSSYVLNHI